MNIGVYVSLQISVFIFFVYIPRSGIARSYDSSIFSFFPHFSTVAAPIYIPRILIIFEEKNKYINMEVYMKPNYTNNFIFS